MRTFNADRFLEEGKTITLGGRTFEVPIVPALTSVLIAQNSEAYLRFHTPQADEESIAVVMKIIASVLNQRVSENDRVNAEWVGQNLDMRALNDTVNLLFGAKEEPEKKNQENETEESEDDSLTSTKQSPGSAATTTGEETGSSTE